MPSSLPLANSHCTSGWLLSETRLLPTSPSQLPQNCVTRETSYQRGPSLLVQVQNKVLVPRKSSQKDPALLLLSFSGSSLLYITSNSFTKKKGGWLTRKSAFIWSLVYEERRASRRASDSFPHQGAVCTEKGGDPALPARRPQPS